MRRFCAGMKRWRLSSTSAKSSLPRGCTSIGPSVSQALPMRSRPPSMRSLARRICSPFSAITSSRPPSAISLTPTRPSCSSCVLGHSSFTTTSTSRLMSVSRRMPTASSVPSSTSTRPKPSPSFTPTFMFPNILFPLFPVSSTAFMQQGSAPAAHPRCRGPRARSHAGPVVVRPGSAPPRRCPGWWSRRCRRRARRAARAA